MFEYDEGGSDEAWNVIDLRHLHSGAIHLLTILALRGIRKEETLQKIVQNSGRLYHMGNDTQEMLEKMIAESAKAK